MAEAFIHKNLADKDLKQARLDLSMICRCHQVRRREKMWEVERVEKAGTAIGWRPK